MRLTVLAEENLCRFAIDPAGEWWCSWCFKRWVEAFRYNPVPEHLAALARATRTQR